MSADVDYRTRGPKVGEMFPDVRLPDQRGAVELQRVHRELERTGYAVLGITYDPQTGLKTFAEKHGINFPLLSDDGSRVIRELGILDEDLEAHHARFGVATRPDHYGVAYPMTFVLDAHGRVERKIVEEQYRSRYGGSWLLKELTDTRTGADAPNVKAPTATAGIVSARASLDSPRYFAYQRLGLHLELTIGPGWHIYGPVVPSGYTGLQIEAKSDPPGVVLGIPAGRRPGHCASTLSMSGSPPTRERSMSAFRWTSSATADRARFVLISRSDPKPAARRNAFRRRALR